MKLEFRTYRKIESKENIEKHQNIRGKVLNCSRVTIIVLLKNRSQIHLIQPQSGDFGLETSKTLIPRSHSNITLFKIFIRGTKLRNCFTVSL